MRMLKNSNFSIESYIRFLSPELDVLVQDMLEDLHRYQERAKENPAKFKKRKRFVTGLREVSRALRLGKLKGSERSLFPILYCVILNTSVYSASRRFKSTICSGLAFLISLI